MIASPDTDAPERFDDPARGEAFWFTLFSGDRTPTDTMSAGVMVVPPGGHLAPHRHAHPELYFIAAGTGVLTIDDTQTIITTGAAAFIPGDATHSIRNSGREDLRVFYVFATDRFTNIVYRFGPAPKGTGLQR